VTKLFDSLRAAQMVTAKAERLGLSFSLRIVTYRKRLRRPMQVRVTIYD